MNRFEAGRRAEAAAVDYLVTQGYSIVGTNVRVGPLELDVVARHGEVIVVIEVRTRSESSFAGALASVDARKRDRIVRAATALWQERYAASDTARLRFDVIAVTLEPAVAIEHVAGAFTA